VHSPFPEPQFIAQLPDQPVRLCVCGRGIAFVRAWLTVLFLLAHFGNWWFPPGLSGGRADSGMSAKHA
jgi:hypothetical protein